MLATSGSTVINALIFVTHRAVFPAHRYPALALSWGAVHDQVLNEVLAANARYEDDFGDKSELPIPPGRRFAILTCMDARLDPAKFAGLAEGDAHVIRNAGGRASDDAIRSLVISYKLLGTREWFVVHHTNCGMETFTDEIMRGLLASSLETATIDKRGWRDTGSGPGSSEGRYIDWLTIDDNARSVVEDVARIRSHPLVNKSIPIYGYIYDVKSGRLIEVPEASAVGSAASALRRSPPRRARSTKGKRQKPLRPKDGSLPKRWRLLRAKRASPAKRSRPPRLEGGGPARPKQPDRAGIWRVPGVERGILRPHRVPSPHRRPRQANGHTATGAPEGVKPRPGPCCRTPRSHVHSWRRRKQGHRPSTSVIKPRHLLSGKGTLSCGRRASWDAPRASARSPACRQLYPAAAGPDRLFLNDRSTGGQRTSASQDRPGARPSRRAAGALSDGDAGLALLDREPRYVRLNERLAAMNGMPLEAHLGRTVREVVPDLADDAEAAFGQVFETGEAISGWQLEGETAHQRGIVRRWSEDIIPIKRCDGSVRALLVVVREVGPERTEETWQRWPRSWTPRRRRSRASPWRASSPAGTPPPRRCSVTPPPRSSAATSRFSRRQPRGRDAGDPGSHPPRRKGRSLRDGAPAQGRQSGSNRSDGLADPRRVRAHHRRLKDRPRHHRAEAAA